MLHEFPKTNLKCPHLHTVTLNNYTVENIAVLWTQNSKLNYIIVENEVVEVGTQHFQNYLQLATQAPLTTMRIREGHEHIYAIQGRRGH